MSDFALLNGLQESGFRCQTQNEATLSEQHQLYRLILTHHQIVQSNDGEEATGATALDETNSTSAPPTNNDSPALLSSPLLTKTQNQIRTLLSLHHNILNTKILIRDYMARYVVHSNEYAQALLEDADGFFFENTISLYPLHIVSCLGLPDLVRMFAEWNDDSRTVCQLKSDNLGWTPIHMATFSKSVECMQILYGIYPEGIKRQDNQHQRVPLHLVARTSPMPNCSVSNTMASSMTISEKKSLACLDYLIQQYPEGMLVKDEYEWYPLHHASYAGPTSHLQLLAQYHPEQAKEVDNFGRLPLMMAACQGSFGSTKLLEELYPEGIKVTDGQNRMALHHAAMNGTCTKSIELLLEKFPRAASLEDNCQMLPLHHYAASSTASASSFIVKKFLDVNANAAKLVDDEGKLPLHLLLEHQQDIPPTNANEEVYSSDLAESVSLLTKAYIKGVSVKDEEGHTPMYYALQLENGEESEEVIKQLTQVDNFASLFSSVSG